MADKITERTPATHTEATIHTTQWERMQKPVITIAIILVVAVAGWFGYKKFIVEPKNEKANDAIAFAAENFAKDSFNLALNGNGANKGAVYVAKEYSGTDAGNLALFYAGVSSLKIGKPEDAIKYLKDFSTSSKPVQTKAYGCLADAYGEKGDKKAALENYKKAASTFPDDEIVSSEYLFRAAQIAESDNNNTEAISIYKELKSKYPATDKGNQAEKYLNRLEVQKNEFTIK